MSKSTYTYTGEGFRFISGVPTRDLTEDEFEALSQEMKEECIKSGLYLPSANPAPKTVATKGAIDLSDGVDDEEATLAGQTLAARRTDK